MASQGIDGLCALANQQVSRAEHDGSGLRLLTFHGDEAHGGPLGGLADRLRIGHVVLLSLDERLHVRRRDQLHRVAELGDLAAPIMRAATGLHGHRAGRERGQERQKLGAAQLLAKDNSSRAVGSVQLKDVLGEIQSDGAHLVHGRLLEWPATPPLWHTKAAGGVHTITATAVATGRRWVKLPKLDIGSTARRACTQDRAASPLEKRRLISAPTSDRLSDWEG